MTSQRDAPPAPAVRPSAHSGPLRLGVAPRLAAAIAAGLVGCSLVLAVRTLADDRSLRDSYLLGNSDFLYPPALYHDLFVDGYGVDGFKFSASTFAFPDVVSFFAVRAVIGSTPAALLPWYGVLLAMLVGAAWAAGRQALPAGGPQAWFPAILLSWVAIYLADMAGRFFLPQPHELLTPGSHNGALAGTLLGFALAVGALRAGSVRGRVGCLAGLAVLCALNMFSDRWYGVWFAAPLGLTLIAARVLNRPSAAGPLVSVRIGAAVVAAVAVGCGAGLIALREFLGPSGDMIDQYLDAQKGSVWAGLGQRVVVCFGVLRDEAAAGNLQVLATIVWYPVAATTVLVAAARRIFGWWPTPGAVPPPSAHPPFVMYCLLTLFVLLCGSVPFFLSQIGIDSLSGDGPWRGYSRYFAGPTGVAFFGLPVWVAFAARAVVPWPARVLAVGGPALAAATFVATVATLPRNWDTDVFDYYPPRVRFVDEVCARRGITHGIGCYWDAKLVTLLSRSGVKLRQVERDPTRPTAVKAWHWLSNARWYAEDPGGGDIRYQFVLTLNGEPPIPGPRPADIVAAYGEPAEAVSDPTGMFVLMVYDRPGDDRLHRVHEIEPSILELDLRYGRDERIRFPAESFQHLPGPRPPGPSRVADDGTPAGPIAWGPYLRLLPGRYRATFRTTSVGAASRVDVFLSQTPGTAIVEAAARDLPPGFDGETPLEFTIHDPNPDWYLQLRTHYAGKGRLVLHWVDLERLGDL